MTTAARVPYALNFRLNELQYRHLVAQATVAELTLSEAMRQALDRDIAAQPDVPIEGNAPGDAGLPYSALLASVQLEAATDQLREHGLLNGDGGGKVNAPS